MKITVESVQSELLINGVRCRKWIGLTDREQRIELYSYMVSSPDGEDFSDDLIETSTPEIL